MKPIYGLFKKQYKKTKNQKSIQIAYDLEDENGWFSQQERPFIGYIQNENK
jgi:hypothetical protein